MAIHLKKIINVFAVTLILFLIVVLVEMAVINTILGCVTFDETKWTENSSCLTFKKFFGF